MNTIDSYGKLLADRKHKWTNEERRIYEIAIAEVERIKSNHAAALRQARVDMAEWFIKYLEEHKFIFTESETNDAYIEIRAEAEKE